MVEKITSVAVNQKSKNWLNKYKKLKKIQKHKDVIKVLVADYETLKKTQGKVSKSDDGKKTNL